jgi:hypothetical protein
MAAITADQFSVSSTGEIRYVTGANHTVIELHRWLGDLMDDAQAVGNDVLDITDSTASERSTDNIITLKYPYNIDQATSEHLYDGSIIQSTSSSNLGEEIYDGILIFAGAGAYVDIIQNGALAANFWEDGINADAVNGISHRFMLQVRDAGVDIDNRTLIGQTREYGYTYSEFKINATSRGNNVMALTYAVDLNNPVADEATIAGYDDITNTEGYRTVTVGSPGNFYSEWNRAGHSINDLYQRIKWLTRRGSSSSIYGKTGDLVRGITHELALTTPRSGTFSATELVSWPTGTGIMFAIDSATTGTKMWIQVLTGVAPGAGVLITGVSTATATTSGTATERSLSFPLSGASTGSALIGSYGFGVEAADLLSTDKVFDLTNTLHTPPNNVTFTVGGLEANQDRVLVGPASGAALNTDQFTLNTTLSGATETAVVCTAAIPVDTPATGTIRIILDSGIHMRVPYTSYTSATFTIGSTDFSGANTATATTSKLYISYIDKLATTATATFTTVYNEGLGARSLFIRVRDGGLVDATPIKTFETTGTLGSAGGSATAIRTPDT